MTSKREVIQKRLDESLQRVEVEKGTALKESPTFDAHLQRAYDESFALSGMLLGFGFLMVLVMAYLIRLGKEPESLIRTFGTFLIVIAAVFLIVAGYSEKQIAPVIGLLGTIAGYLLGKSSGKKDTQ